MRQGLKQQGFTLVELLIVTSLIALVALGAGQIFNFFFKKNKESKTAKDRDEFVFQIKQSVGNIQNLVLNASPLTDLSNKDLQDCLNISYHKSFSTVLGRFEGEPEHPALHCKHGIKKPFNLYFTGKIEGPPRALRAIERLGAGLKPSGLAHLQGYSSIYEAQAFKKDFSVCENLDSPKECPVFVQTFFIPSCKSHFHAGSSTQKTWIECSQAQSIEVQFRVFYYQNLLPEITGSVFVNLPSSGVEIESLNTIPPRCIPVKDVIYMNEKGPIGQGFFPLLKSCEYPREEKTEWECEGFVSQYQTVACPEGPPVLKKVSVSTPKERKNISCSFEDLLIYAQPKNCNPNSLGHIRSLTRTSTCCAEEKFCSPIQKIEVKDSSGRGCLRDRSIPLTKVFCSKNQMYLDPPSFSVQCQDSFGSLAVKCALSQIAGQSPVAYDLSCMPDLNAGSNIKPEGRGEATYHLQYRCCF